MGTSQSTKLHYNQIRYKRVSNPSTNCAQQSAKEHDKNNEIENKKKSENQKLLLLYEANISLLRQLLNDPTVQIEEPRGANLLTKFQSDPTVNEATSDDLRLVLSFLRKSLSFRFSLFSLNVFYYTKTLPLTLI